MRAIEIREPGGPEVLVPTNRPTPTASDTQLLIKVAAAGVNRPDCLQRQGAYPPPPGASDIPGLEIAGKVEAVGKAVSRFKIGDNVCALVPGGGYAEFCVVDETNSLPAPNGLTMIEAAAIPETFFTVWHNVFQRGGLKDGETFLVHGGTSGIGTTAIQLAKAFGAKVFATAGSDAKCAAMLDLGADLAINYKQSDFVEVIRQKTDGKGVDLILDMVGGDYITRNYKAAAIEGRIVQIAFLNGRKAEVDFSLLMMKRLTHTGSTLRARDIAFKAAIASELQQHVWPLLNERKVLPVMDSIYPLEQAAAAHQRMEDGDHIGKIVLDAG
ncbi:NAD(P)H-quinone oxidoreductase [Hoeflea sp.]|uniref:NAD(P)H-quinone oxidoreductase n=1 Tax=Hoeflea sp. TaxID=1940281 RepID=UPI00374914C1